LKKNIHICVETFQVMALINKNFMKNTIIAFAMICSLCACMKKAEEASQASADSSSGYTSATAPSEYKSERAAESVSGDKEMNGNAETYISSSAAKVSAKDSNRKFVRTADLRFRVKNVIKATYEIEDIVVRQDGFVTLTNLHSTIDYVENTAISKDSTLESTHYTVQNNMTIRVPNRLLDTTLKQIAKLVDYMDYRIIKAEDVSLQLLTNRLSQKRLTQHEQHLREAIAQRGRKLEETVTAEDNLLNRKEQADNSMVSNLYLNDQVQMSTITLALYQKQAVQRELTLNDRNIEAYQPSFGSQILEALFVGWNVLQSVLIFIVKIWWLILLALGAYFLWKKYRSKFDK
jgi:hypothetical protein